MNRSDIAGFGAFVAIGVSIDPLIAVLTGIVIAFVYTTQGL